jgi:hypothetical protein
VETIKERKPLTNLPAILKSERVHYQQATRECIEMQRSEPAEEVTE